MSFSPQPSEPIQPTRPSAGRGRDRELSYPATLGPPEAAIAPPRPRATWLLWSMLVLLTSLALAVLLPTLAGVYVGLQERSQYLHDRAVDHYKQALAYEAEDYTELAVAELQISVKFDPSYQPAVQKLAEMQTTPTANGTAVPDSAAIANQLFTRAQTAVANKQWSDAIDSLEEIRRADSSYRADEVKALLLQAYLSGGKQSISAGEIGQARARFEAALALDPNNAEAKSLRDRAALYVAGQQAGDSGDWQSAAVNFQKLFQLEPTFADVKQQLVNALIRYGDAATGQGASCIAAREYDQAVRLGAGADVSAKLAQANVSCKQAVTAPTATPTLNAQPYSVSAHAIASGACQGTGSVNGTVHDMQGNPLPGVIIQIYNDVDYRPPPFTTDVQGKYSIMLGKDAGLFHLVVIGPDGTAASSIFDLRYPGGGSKGCRWQVDWTKSE